MPKNGSESKEDNVCLKKETRSCGMSQPQRTVVHPPKPHGRNDEMRFTYRSGQRTRESRECEEAGSRTHGARTGTRTSGPAGGRCRLLGGLVLCLLATAPSASARPGDLDRSFRGTGIARTRIQRISDADCLVQQADGKLVAAGTSTSGLGPAVFQNRIALVRYNADGTLDQTFGAGTGIVITLIGDLTSTSALVMQPDGKIVVAGASVPATVVSEPVARSPNFTLVRYNVDGTLDQSFGRLGSGAVTVPSGGFASGLMQQADGKLVAAGFQRLHQYDVFTVVRYLD